MLGSVGVYLVLGMLVYVIIVSVFLAMASAEKTAVSKFIQNGENIN